MALKPDKYRSPVVSWCVQCLVFFKFRHLVFALTAALGAAILCSALLTGESLQSGLRRDMKARLGDVRSGVIRSSGVFPVALAERIPASEAALMLRGEILSPDGIVCADRANIFGIVEDSRDAQRPAGTVSVNNRAAEIISSFNGSGWSYRFEKPSPFSVELPLGAGGEDDSARSIVQRVLPVRRTLISEDFDPSPASVLPVNIRVPYRDLAAAAGAVGAANLLLSELDAAELKKTLQERMTAQDVGLQVIRLDDRTHEIKSGEVFIPEAFCRALRESGKNCQWSVFHLADDFCSVKSTNTTPYGFTAALTPDGTILPADMTDDQVVVNQWLADVLDLRAGDDILLKWRRFEPDGHLVAEEGTFRVRRIMSMEEASSLRERMPVLPGLEGVDSCAEWDIGMPMDEEKLSDKANEEYWKKYRETPKVVMTYAAGKKSFGTVFGEAMGVRVNAEVQELEDLLRRIDPAEIGFQTRALWQEGNAAARGATDFRALFVGMSFLLMVSALLLAGLTLSLLLDSRVFEPALLSALGVAGRRVVFFVLLEWIPATLAGSVLGAFGGTLLSRALVWSLSRFWRDAFAGASIGFHYSMRAAVISVVATVVLLLLILSVKIFRFCSVAPVSLLRQRGADSTGPGAPRLVLLYRICGPLCTVAALLIMFLSGGTLQANGAFFGAGFLLMVSLFLFAGHSAAAWSSHFGGAHAVIHSPFAAGVIAACKSGGRGKTLVALISLGFFLTVGMLAMKHDPAAGSERASSGSGGFQSIVYSTAEKTLHDGMELAGRVSGAGKIVPVRVREGDEAGCMNMSVPQVPRLYGVPVARMIELRAFEPENAGGVWSVLRDELEDGVIPAMASDQAMLQYSLKMKAGLKDGDEMDYRGSDGRIRRIRIVGVLPVRISVLQGALILNEDHFVKMFPGEGYRMWLCDYAPYALRADNAPRARYPEPGVRIETAAERLRTLGRMESTYLDMFLVLGGLGLLLGVFGVALVIARSIDERRYEFAVLQAVGIRRRRIVLSLLSEYGTLTVTGVLTGLVPALIAVQPAASSLNTGINGSLVAAVVALLVAAAMASVVVGALYALRGFDLSLLKRE